MDDQRSADRLENDTEELGREGHESEQELKQHGDKLQEQIDDVREDWERKQEDSAVPGAVGDALEGSKDQPDAGDLPDGPG